ncbi:MAG: hypothetical protein GY796_21955 [Chloroflexi bacterium]|nr:hypothetical protein [Chloroflexota bacterium]
MHNLVTYVWHQEADLPPNDAVFYQYITAANGVFVRAENDFVDACFLVTAPVPPGISICGLHPLKGWLRLKAPKIPFPILEQAVADAQNTPNLNETLYYVTWANGRYHLRKPTDQQGTPAAVRSHIVETDTLVVMDIHSHGRADPFFSPTDDHDETRLRFYGVIGSLNAVPQFKFRLGIYGHWVETPANALFQMVPQNKDAYSWM